jgi:phage/plasmid-like protein (TIGR03299 family)
MPAGILQNRFVEVNTYGRITAWHQIGQVHTPGLLPSEAIRNIGDGLNIRMQQAGYFDLQRDQWTAVPGQFALVRDQLEGETFDQWLNWVSGAYRMVSAMKLFSMLDGIAKYWPLETAGILDNGATAWALFNVDEPMDVGGDKYQTYFAVADHTDGKRGLETFFTTVRIVCKNTYDIAIGGAEVLGTVRHDKNVEQNTVDTLNLMAKFGTKRSEVIEAFERMRVRHLSQAEIQEMIEQALPLPTTPKLLEQAAIREIQSSVLDRKTREHQTKVVRRERERAQVYLELARFNKEQPAQKDTPLAVMQAVAAWADHFYLREASGASAVFGKRADAKIRAYQQAIALV